jgi:hypothetical protein
MLSSSTGNSNVIEEYTGLKNRDKMFFLMHSSLCWEEGAGWKSRAEEMQL